MILAIDSSALSSSIALKTPHGIFEWSGDADRVPHSEELSTHINELMLRAGAAPKDLQLLVYGKGPGSFTGLRIGLSILKGISLSLKIPIVSLSSLKAMAASARDANGALISGPISAIADARRGEVFCGHFEIKGGVISAVGQEEIISFEALNTRLSTLGATVVFQEIIPGLQLEPSIRQEKVVGVARGLITLVDAERAEVPAYSLEQLSPIVPTYLREVAVKTIRERMGPTLV